MKFSVEPEIFTQWPGIRVGVMTISHLDNRGKSGELEGLLRQEEAKQAQQLADIEIGQIPQVIAWRKIYREFGSDPGDYRSSVEALLRRVKARKPLPSINKLVDMYNYLSIKYWLPAGAEDTDKVSGDITLARAQGTETGVYLGSQEEETCYPGEVIYKDRKGFICRRWNWREAERTKIDADTQNAVLVFEAVPGVEGGQIEPAMAEAEQLVKSWGGDQVRVEKFVLSQARPEIEMELASVGKAGAVGRRLPGIGGQLQAALAEAVAEATGQVVVPAEVGLEHPEVEEFGDYSSNVALVLKGGRPLAQRLAEQITNLKSPFVNQVSVAGPGFINFRLVPQTLISLMSKALDIPQWGKGQKWLIEHTSPNPNKAMHLGHLRNNATGMAIANIWEACGVVVIRDDIDNNRGIAIAKLMWGYQKFGGDRTPAGAGKRPDRFVDELYVKASEEFDKDEKVQKEVRQMVVDWEAEDKTTWDLWRRVLAFSYQGQELTLKRLGNKWDKIWHEHEHYKQGKQLVEEGLEKGVFRKVDSGAILTNLSRYNLPDTVVIKSDGTALYITQDLALTKLKRETFKPDKLYWCIGPEQGLALKQLFAVCEQLGIGKKEDYVHIAYGYMSIKGQGKMSSRRGNVVYIDDLLDTAVEKAKTFNSDPQIAEGVGVGAVKYSILKVGRLQDTAFDIGESVSLEGNSGPYLQYTYVRCRSVLAKAERIESSPLDGDDLTLNQEELRVLGWIYRYPEVVEEAALRYSPNLVCNFLYELAQRYNAFYNQHSILSAATAAQKKFRLQLTAKVGEVLKSGLDLLGIAAPEKM